MKVKLSDGTWMNASEDSTIEHQLPVPVYANERLWDGMEYSIISHVIGFEVESVMLVTETENYPLDIEWWKEYQQGERKI